jgi:hypothetical protein
LRGLATSAVLPYHHFFRLPTNTGIADIARDRRSRDAELGEIDRHVAEHGVSAKRPPVRSRKGPGGPPARLQDVKRYPGGQIRYERVRDDPGNAFANIQRVSAVDPSATALAIHLLGAVARSERRLRGRRPTRDEFTEQAAERDALGRTNALIGVAVRDEKLSYPVGVLFLRGVFGDDREHTRQKRCSDDPRRGPCDRCRQAALMHRAALKYAALHCTFWGGLKQDVAQGLHPSDLRELNSTGRNGMPKRRIPSHLSKLLAAIVGTEDFLTEDEYQKWYAGIRDRYRASRQALMQAGLAALNMVERTVIDELPPGPVGMPGMWRLTPGDASSLRIGLCALVQAFRLDDPERERPREAIPLEDVIGSSVAPQAGRPAHEGPAVV